MNQEIKKKNFDEDKRKKRWFCLGGIVISAALITGAVLLTRYLTIKKYRSAVTITFNAKDGVFADTQLKTYKLEVEKTTHFKDIVNKVNQPKLASYVFEGWKNGNKLVDDFIINDDVTLNASYIAPDPKSFATDSWSTIACIADQGLDKLKEVYRPAQGTFVITDEDDTEEEIAAKTRSVCFDTQGTFKVRVIGENHDYLSNTTNKVAALTFEFSEIINPAVPDKFREFDDYITSNLRHYLQDNVYATIQTDLRSNLRLVKKEACSVLVADLVTIDDYFFPLSFAEIANVEEYGVAFIQEGSLYEYYQNPNHGIGKLYQENPDLDFYRLRSLDDNRITQILSVVGERISSVSSEELSGGCGIAPAFCIGETTLTNANSCFVTWDNTTYTNDPEFSATLNEILGGGDEAIVQNAYIKNESNSDDYAQGYRVSSTNDLAIDLTGVDKWYDYVPEETMLGELEERGYSFIKIGDTPLSIANNDYDVHFYMGEEGVEISDYSRCEIVIPADKITGDVKITLFSLTSN